MEMADRALGRGNIRVYNELSAAAVVQSQPKLRALTGSYFCYVPLSEPLSARLEASSF